MPCINICFKNRERVSDKNNVAATGMGAGFLSLPDLINTLPEDERNKLGRNKPGRLAWKTL